MKGGNNWLITGGCGFIGINLINRILRERPTDNIRVLDNLSVGKREDLNSVCSYKEWRPDHDIFANPEGVELVVGDVAQKDVALNATKGIDIIIHLAANTGVAPSVENPRLDCEVNVIGTLNMLEAARIKGVKKFVFASSGAPLGEQDPPIHEEKVPRPVSPYGASKLAGEAYCSAYYRTFGINTIALRFGNVYGPGSKYKDSVVAKFIKRALDGLPLEIYGDGKQTRDFIYINDLIDAVMLAAECDLGGEVFQIATYRETTVDELTEQLVKVLQGELPELQVNINYGRARLGDVKRNYSDITKAKEVLGFEPKYDLESGLRETVRWFLREARANY